MSNRTLAILTAIAFFAAVWCWQYRSIPAMRVEITDQMRAQVARARAIYGDVTPVCADGVCWIEIERKRVRL